MMPAWVVLLAGAVGVYLAASTPSGATAPASGSLSVFAEAIAFAEGFGLDPGNVPTRANNPGDLKLSDTIVTGSEGVTVFPSVADGWAALTHQLRIIATNTSAVYASSMSIGEMAVHWTDTQSATWAEHVVAYLQTHGYPAATVDTPLAQVLA